MKRSPLHRKAPMKRTEFRATIRNGASLLPKDWAKRNSLQWSWSKLVKSRRGEQCVAADSEYGPCEGDLQADHIWPKSQGGPYAVENGAVLCRRHHQMKTDGQLQYKREWLGEDQVAWLADQGWVRWDDDGDPWGRGWKHFQKTSGHPVRITRKGGQE